MAHDVFISYSKEDKPTVHAICAALEATGIKCWLAPRDILGGSKWGGAIIRAITKSRVMVLVFSSSANDSHNVEREVERAASKKVPIVPFRIDDVSPSENLEYYLGTAHWIEAMTPPEDHHLQQLIDSVKILLETFPKGVQHELDSTTELVKNSGKSTVEFIALVAHEVEAVMKREMFTPPGGPAYIPRLYIVYLSYYVDRNLQGGKRRAFELGLYHLLSRSARKLSEGTQLAVKSFAVEIRPDDALDRGEFRVEPVWEDPSGKTKGS